MAEEAEYQPQEEIASSEERKTLVSLYFINKSSKQLEPEGRLVDVKDLVKDPYNMLVKLLIGGPKNENLENVIPPNTNINGITLKKDILEIDFSSELIENEELTKEEEENIIKSLVNTLTELTEVNGIKILIDGEEGKGFKNELITFEKEFTRENEAT